MAVLGGAIAGAGSLGGAIMGSSAAKKQTAAAADLYRQQMARLDALQIPDIEKQKIALQSLSYLGSFTPEQEQAIIQQASELNNISLDPRLKTAQMNALQTLSQMGQTPFDATEKAEINKMRREISGQEQARQNSILQSLAQRGMLGSGQELAQRLSSSQGSADRASQESDALMAMAQKRMLDAIAQSGNLATSISDQDFNQQAEINKAQDVINQFNTQNRRDVQMRNIGAKNVAGATSQEEKQRIAEANIDLRNKEQIYNKELLQQKFENEYRKAGGQATALGSQANNLLAGAANAGESWMNIGSGAGKLGAGLAGLYSQKSTPSTPISGGNLTDSNEFDLTSKYKTNPYGY